MKILYVHQYFRTPVEGGCIRSYLIGKGLVKKGHHVIMITAHDEPYYKKELVEGIEVHYLPEAYDNSFGFIKRMSAFLGFLYKSCRLAGKIQQVDLAYVMTTPLTTGFIALYLKKFKKIPYYFEVGDLWPEVPIQMGVLKNFVLKGLARWLERTTYRQAKGLVGLSPGIQQHIQKFVTDKKAMLIPNMSENDFFGPSEYKGHDLKVLYCGTIGKANHLEYLVDVARACAENGLPVTFTIVGEGAEKEYIRQLSDGLKNMSFLEFTNRIDLKPIIDEHDAFFVSFLNLPILHTGSPNKYFDGLAAGKMMIVNLSGWFKELTETNSCGFYYNPDIPAEFIEKVSIYLKKPEKIREAQKNARKLAEDHFAVETYVDLLDKELNTN